MMSRWTDWNRYVGACIQSPFTLRRRLGRRAVPGVTGSELVPAAPFPWVSLTKKGTCRKPFSWHTVSPSRSLWTRSSPASVHSVFINDRNGLSCNSNGTGKFKSNLRRPPSEQPWRDHLHIQALVTLSNSLQLRGSEAFEIQGRATIITNRK